MRPKLRLDRLIDWFHDMRDRARGKGLALGPIEPDEVSRWGAIHLIGCEDDLDLAEQIRRSIPAFPESSDGR